MLRFDESKGVLIDGMIPKGTECPFLEDKCRGGMGEGKCPTKEHPFSCDYSCGLARGYNLTLQYEE